MKTWLFLFWVTSVAADILMWNSITPNVDSQCQLAAVTGTDLYFLSDGSLMSPIMGFPVQGWKSKDFQLLFNNIVNPSGTLLSFSVACRPTSYKNALTSTIFLLHFIPYNISTLNTFKLNYDGASGFVKVQNESSLDFYFKFPVE